MKHLAKMMTGTLTVVALLLAACGDSGGSEEPAQDSGNNQGAPASKSPAASPSAASAGGGAGTCGLLSFDELSRVVGKPFVDPGRPYVTPGTPQAAAFVAEYLSGPGMALTPELVGSQAGICQWVSQDSLEVVEALTMSATAYDALRAGRRTNPDVRDLAGIGNRAYTISGLAHAAEGEKSVLVMATLTIEQVNETEAAVALLRFAWPRR